MVCAMKLFRGQRVTSVKQLKALQRPENIKAPAQIKTDLLLYFLKLAN